MNSGVSARLTICLLFAAALSIAPNAEARFGETLGQCVQRYGQPVAKFDGRNSIFGVAIFCKDEIVVTTVFGRQTRKCVAVAYMHGDYVTVDARRKMKSLGNQQVAALEGTVAGRWEPLDMGAPAAKPNRSSTAGEIAMRNAVERATRAKSALERLLVALSAESPRFEQGRFLHDSMPFSKEDGAYSEYGEFSLRPAKHMGRNVFSMGLFALDLGAMQDAPRSSRRTYRNGRRAINAEGVDELCYGFAIVDSDSAQAIESWAASQLAALQGATPRDHSEQTLKGF